VLTVYLKLRSMVPVFAATKTAKVCNTAVNFIWRENCQALANCKRMDINAQKIESFVSLVSEYCILDNFRACANPCNFEALQ
jgi:hypothetical protein